MFCSPFVQRGLGGFRLFSFQILDDCGDDAIHIFQHIKEGSAFVCVVLATVNLNNQSSRGAIEINYVLAERLLPIKLEVVNLLSSQSRP